MSRHREDAGVAQERVQTGLERSLVVGICLVVFPLRIFSHGSSETTDRTSPDSGRTAAGTFMVVGALVEGVSITSHTHIPYLGAGHFVQGDWLNGTVFLGSEVGLFILENTLRARVGPGDFGRYPAYSNGTISVKSNGLSPASEAMKQYADLAQHSEFHIMVASGEVIAIHFWLDFITSVVEFIQNPRNGRFVYGVTWKL